MGVAYIFFLALVSAVAASASDSQTSDQLAANPIRKVVTMLQAMQKKIGAEGEKETALYDKFNCYCKNAGGTLGASISAAEAKVPNVGSDIESSEAKVVQDKSDLKRAQADRAAAKSAMAEASAIRAKEAAEFAAEKAEASSNIASLAGAIGAVEKGMTGFLQTQAAASLKRIVLSDKDLADYDREELVSFLSGAQNDEYAPQSGQITGILKEMKDTMSKNLASAEAGESDAISSFDQLMAAKTKEVNALTKTVEAKTVRIGEMAVEIVQMKEDLSDTQAALLEDQKFLGDMDKNCAAKASEFEANTKTRGEELVALSETIKLLNDDDALELFKKTLPSASASFLQMKVATESQRAHALAKISEARSKMAKPNPSLDFIALALQGKKVNFAKVITMIDNMVSTLGAEQRDDNDKKEYCAKQFDFADDKKKGLERSVADTENEIAKQTDSLATLKDEIKSLEDGIKALDKEVAEATEQRKEENQDFTSLMASDAAAKELLGFAKNRMNQFYNPKLAKAAASFVQLAEVRQHQQDAPAPPPATAAAFSKKSEESNGVIAMIDLLIKDLDKELTEAGTAEKDSQADYETAMKDSADKRALDSKTLSDKGAAKASVQADLETNKEEKTATTKELMATGAYISSLHAECDWLLQYFEVRKEARTGEIDSLKNAKAVLSGADFSLVQLQQGRRLRGLA